MSIRKITEAIILCFSPNRIYFFYESYRTVKYYKNPFFLGFIFILLSFSCIIFVSENYFSSQQKLIQVRIPEEARLLIQNTFGRIMLENSSSNTFSTSNRFFLFWFLFPLILSMLRIKGEKWINPENKLAFKDIYAIGVISCFPMLCFSFFSSIWNIFFPPSWYLMTFSEIYNRLIITFSLIVLGIGIEGIYFFVLFKKQGSEIASRTTIVWLFPYLVFYFMITFIFLLLWLF